MLHIDDFSSTISRLDAAQAPRCMIFSRQIAIIITTILSPLATGNVAPLSSSETAPTTLLPFSISYDDPKSSQLDLSYLLKRPAGKDGYITVQGGHFFTPSGDRFKIWGVNLSWGACLPEKKDAPAYAAFLARFGINAVRFHFLDSNYGQEHSLFDYSATTTRVLHPQQLDKLDFFVSELKRAGIYIDLNLNVGRTYRKDDGVPDYERLGFAKSVTFFDDHIIELQKEYAKQLLTHVNPYTGLSFANEPAVLMVEILNENSLTDAWAGGRLLGENTAVSDSGNATWRDIPPYYGKELTKMFNLWLRQNVDPAHRASIAVEAKVNPGDEIPRLAPKEFKDASKVRFQAEAQFLLNTERNFFTGMYNYLRND
ncbi:MAG: hypothetical protein WCK00_10150, partial [Deltaproteobacteria bacterium]